jgi:hypothetical protein
LVPLYKSVLWYDNGTRMMYSCLNGCGAIEKVPSMKMKKVWALANLSKLSGWVCLWCWLPGLSWHLWFLSI